MISTKQIWKDLAGSAYTKLVQSRELAIAHLNDRDSRVRIASLHICRTVWNCISDDDYLDACRRMAEGDPVDEVRVHAIGLYANGLRGTRDRDAKRLLALLVQDQDNSDATRLEAYWGLREVEFGLTEEDVVNRTFSLMKRVLSKKFLPDEEQVMHEVSATASQIGIDLESVDSIDWEFVGRCISA